MGAVLVEKSDGVMDIVLNRPEHLNAMNQELMIGLNDAISRAEEPGVRAVLIRGSGKGFCAGGDIRQFAEFLQKDVVPRTLPDTLHQAIQRLRELPRPVVAQINGPCAGAGFSLAMACDLAVAAESAKFNLAYAGIGISPDGSSTYHLPKHVGLKKAMEMFFLPQKMSADEVLELGLINRVVPDEKLEDECRLLVKKLAAGPTKALGMAKILVNRSVDYSLEEQLRLESDYVCESVISRDFKAGVNAFLRKEKPEFTGE